MRLFRHTILFLAALVFLFEAWLWDVLSAFWRWLADFPAVRKARVGINSLVAFLPPYGAMALFVIPVLVIFPFKVAALWLIASGKIILGGLMFLLAKAVGMAAAAFLFELTKPKLMTVGWFVRLYNWLLAARDWAHRLADPYMTPVRNVVRSWKAQLATFIGSGKPGVFSLLVRLRDRIRHKRSAK